MQRIFFTVVPVALLALKRLALFGFVLSASVAWAGNGSKLDTYSETSLGKPSICGINFYADYIDEIHHEYLAAYGSVFVLLGKKGLGYGFRVDELEGNANNVKESHTPVPVRFAKLTVENNISTDKMQPVTNKEDPDGYSAISYNADDLKLITRLQSGGELLVQASRDATDTKFVIAPQVDTEVSKKLSQCLESLVAQAKQK